MPVRFQRPASRHPFFSFCRRRARNRHELSGRAGDNSNYGGAGATSGSTNNSGGLSGTLTGFLQSIVLLIWSCLRGGANAEDGDAGYRSPTRYEEQAYDDRYSYIFYLRSNKLNVIAPLKVVRIWGTRRASRLRGQAIAPRCGFDSLNCFNVARWLSLECLFEN